MKFCADYGIRHEVSSPYNSQSNGHAKAGVKNLKGLIQKVLASDFDLALFAWCNMVCRDGLASPAELFFGQRLCGTWLVIDPTCNTGDGGNACPQDKLRPLCISNKVHLQYHGSWGLFGMIGLISCTNRSYGMRMEDGCTIHCNRQFLKSRL